MAGEIREKKYKLNKFLGIPELNLVRRTIKKKNGKCQTKLKTCVKSICVTTTYIGNEPIETAFTGCDDDGEFFFFFLRKLLRENIWN